MPFQDSASARRPVVEIIDPMVVEILRRMTPTERLQQAFSMWETARIITQGGVAHQHPDWNEQQVLREVAKRLSHGATERIPR